MRFESQPILKEDRPLSQKLFFELLQVAIGNQSSLSAVPTPKQWKKLYQMAQKQSLVAITFRGVSMLEEQDPEDDGFGSSIIQKI